MRQQQASVQTELAHEHEHVNAYGYRSGYLYWMTSLCVLIYINSAQCTSNCFEDLLARAPGRTNRVEAWLLGVPAWPTHSACADLVPGEDLDILRAHQGFGVRQAARRELAAGLTERDEAPTRKPLFDACQNVPQVRGTMAQQ
jgi:hypothetical protein